MVILVKYLNKLNKMKTLTFILLITVLILTYTTWTQKQQINDLYNRDITTLQVIKANNDYSHALLLEKVDYLEKYIEIRFNDQPKIDLTYLEKQIKINHSLAVENAEDIFRLHRWHWEGEK